jgi:hypothetical protein
VNALFGLPPNFSALILVWNPIQAQFVQRLIRHTTAIVSLSALFIGSLISHGNLISGGLEWVDVSQTTDLSFTDVVTQFDQGGLFEGFRHATTTEVIQLTESFGYDFLASEQANAGPISSLQDAIGTTFVSSASFLQYSTLGYVDDGQRMDLTLQILDPGEPATWSGFLFQTDPGPAINPDPAVGHYLVMAVPEPAEFTLMLGLIAVGWIIKKRSVRGERIS